MTKLNQKRVAESGWKADTIPAMQVAIFTMCGGGMLGHMAAEQPETFYIDDRVGRLPYPKKQIYQAVETLKTIARANGLDPKHMPEMPKFHNMGIF
jgi:hypothetical protein